MTNNKLICIGKIISAHGIRGQVKIHSYTEIPEEINNYSPLLGKDGLKSYKVNIKSCNNEILIANIDGINDRNAAEALKGEKLYTTRKSLPETEENEFYYEDLAGLKVLSKSGEEYGIVEEINNYGAGDIITIKLKNGKQEEYSLSRDIFPEISIDKGTITFIAPEILMDDK